ncbi:MAG: FIST C-terminal domain-containing protein [Thermoleophilia bacterium]|nr:FIST C-terminal domain-containing protein [Thermoleophilia bacterium]
MIRIGQSNAPDAEAAVRELHEQVTQPDTELVVFFCSTEYDLDIIAREVNQVFAGVTVVGCTTAGEIGPMGYLDHSLSGFSLPSSSFTAVCGSVDDLRRFAPEDGESLAHLLLGQLESRVSDTYEQSIFAFQMTDGLSVREESVTRAFQHALGRIPLVGGSAGDGERYAHAYVFSAGRFQENSAVLVLAATSLPFTTFSTFHFSGTDRRAVVTAADPETRTVTEIDGLPAVEGYARLCGVDVSEVGSSFYGDHPLMVRIGGTDYARSVVRVNPDGSLTLFCAIEEGVVLRAAERGDIVADLEEALERVQRNVGRPTLVIACDCTLRSLEIGRLGLKERVSETFRRCNASGFATYGEQFYGVHINQTLTGIAFGGSEKM